MIYYDLLIDQLQNDKLDGLHVVRTKARIHPARNLAAEGKGHRDRDGEVSFGMLMGCILGWDAGVVPKRWHFQPRGRLAKCVVLNSVYMYLLYMIFTCFIIRFHIMYQG